MFLPLAAVGGTPVLGFAVVLCGFALYEVVRLALDKRRAREVSRSAAAVALLGVAVPVVGALAARPLVSDRAEDGTATVAVIQGNVPRLGLEFNAQRRAVLDYHARETERLAARVAAGEVARPDFVLWPENSSDIDPFAYADAAAVIDKAAKAIGAPISVGGVVERDGKFYNEQILWDPVKGPTQTYDKRQVQPFGEYLRCARSSARSTRTGPRWSARTSAGAAGPACSTSTALRWGSPPATRPPSTGPCATPSPTAPR